MTDGERFSRAGSYVLGLMGEADRERAERDLEVDPAFRDAVFKVAERMHKIELPRVEGGPANDWKRIAMHIAGMPQMRGLDSRPAVPASINVQAGNADHPGGAVPAPARHCIGAHRCICRR